MIAHLKDILEDHIKRAVEMYENADHVEVRAVIIRKKNGKIEKCEIKIIDHKKSKSKKYKNVEGIVYGRLADGDYD